MLLPSLLLASVLARPASAQSMPGPAPSAPLGPSERRALTTFAGALLGGAAGLLIAKAAIAEREAESSEGLHGPEAAFTALGFCAGGVLVGGVLGYIIGRPSPAPPPAAATTWSEIRRRPALGTTEPGARRIVFPLLALSF